MLSIKMYAKKTTKNARLFVLQRLKPIFRSGYACVGVHLALLCLISLGLQIVRADRVKKYRPAPHPLQRMMQFLCTIEARRVDVCLLSVPAVLRFMRVEPMWLRAVGINDRVGSRFS